MLLTEKKNSRSFQVITLTSFPRKNLSMKGSTQRCKRINVVSPFGHGYAFYSKNFCGGGDKLLNITRFIQIKINGNDMHNVIVIFFS